MKQLTPSEIQYFQSLIDSLQHECQKAKETGTVATSYIKEKTDKIQKLIK